MINTKLIFVDGIPGSGKSTIAHSKSLKETIMNQLPILYKEF